MLNRLICITKTLREENVCVCERVDQKDREREIERETETKTERDRER